MSYDSLPCPYQDIFILVSNYQFKFWALNYNSPEFFKNEDEMKSNVDDVIGFTGWFNNQKSPYKWIERDAPLRYLDTFMYHTINGMTFPDSTFALYGTDVEVMIPNNPTCRCPRCVDFFPQRVFEIFDNCLLIASGILL